MLHTFRILILLLVVALGLVGRVFAADTSIAISGAETQPSGAWDTSSITISFGDSAGNSYSETVTYGQFSTFASIASAFGAKFSNDYSHSGLLCTHAVGSVIYFHLNGTDTFGVPSIIDSSPSFSVAPSSWLATPMLSVVTSKTPSTPGSSITFTATTSSGPTGTVTFYDGGTSIGAGTINGNTATYTTSTLAVGIHTITAGWAGNTNYSAVTSVPITQLVEDITLPGPGIINTIVGNGTFGYWGDGGLAASAVIEYPTGLAVDPSGDIYISDEDFRIREVSASTGIITTVAGNGTSGYSGDDGPATSAELGYPSGVAVNSLSGNIYIADGNSRVIREVINGYIYTVAGNGTSGYSGDGGPATSAELGYPSGVAVNSLSGNIYFVDGSSRIREVINGYIYTVAGTGTSGYSGDGGPATSAELNGVYGVAVDAAGNIYINDEGNNRIRAVYSSGTLPNIPNPVVGNIYTVAGNGTRSYSGDGGPATNAELNNSYGIAADSAGNLFIVDGGNERIRKVAASNGYISTVAGNGTYGFSGDGGPATNAELSLFGVNTISFSESGIAVDAFGNFYFSDSANYRIRAVGAQETVSSVLVSCSPNSITVGGANSVCTVSVGGGATGTVSLTYNGTYWATLTLVSGSASATFSSTIGIGSYTISATYSGDEYHTAATGLTVLNVNKVIPTVSLSSSLNPMLSGGSSLSVFTATINGGVSPTGIVTFQIDGATFGTASVSGGIAVYNGSNEIWAAGFHTISAIYSGDPNNATATGITAEIVSGLPTGGLPPTMSLSAYVGFPGSLLTITGSGFGSSGAVTFGTVQASVVTSWSANSITVQVPVSLAAGTYPVVVNVNNLNGAVAGEATFLVSPQITSLVPNSGPPTMGLVILGSGFGQTQGASTVTIGPIGDTLTTASVIPGLWGDTSITIQVPSGMSIGSVLITVNVAYGSFPYFSDSNPWPFTVTDPFGCN
jgi:hypothetical protein